MTSRLSLYLSNLLDKTVTKCSSCRDLQVPFNSQREAEIAHGTLSVDPEPKRGGCKKSLKVDENTLHVHFDASEAKSLRVGVNSFFDHLNLVVKTIDQFGPPQPIDSS